ncbi:MAG: hypothetical protein KDC38_21730, partial [Planctomycetes bacterium]|nr:hypothetical protein [Planctomycetota bacterium]
QWVRCRRLAELGALRMLEPEQAMQPHVLAAAIRAAFDDPSSPPRIACDGAESAARLCLAARRQCRSEAPLMRLG